MVTISLLMRIAYKYSVKHGTTRLSTGTQDHLFNHPVY
jgi:hypothetical protein